MWSNAEGTPEGRLEAGYKDELVTCLVHMEVKHQVSGFSDKQKYVPKEHFYVQT